MTSTLHDFDIHKHLREIKTGQHSPELMSDKGVSRQLDTGRVGLRHVEQSNLCS